MKKLLLVGTILLLATVTHAAGYYPNKLNNNESFSGFEHFQNVYNKIYKDVHNENKTKVCIRALEDPELTASITVDKTIADCKKLKKLSVPDFFETVFTSKKKFARFRNYAERQFDLEKSLLRFENDLARRNGLTSIFSDGDCGGGTKNSPFDLVVDLNKIDKIFFGEKAEKPCPKWLTSPTDEDDGEFISKAEPWQDQSKEKPKSPFSKPDSIAGGLEALVKIIKKAITFSLVAVKSTKYIFESDSDTTGLPSGSGEFNVNTPNPAAASQDPPEWETVQETTVGGELEMLEKDAFLKLDCPELEKTKDISRKGHLRKAKTCRQEWKDGFEQSLQEFHEETQLNIEKEHNRKISPALDNWNGFLDVFEEQVSQIVKILKIFLLKTSK